MNEIRKLILPSTNYGPFCLKILDEFKLYHKLSQELPVPTYSLPLHESLSRIFDIMLHSMGEEKRNEILIELDEYAKSLPVPSPKPPVDKPILNPIFRKEKTKILTLDDFR